MNRSKFLFLSGGVFLLLTPYFSAAANLQGTIEGFRLFSCGTSVCYTIISDEAFIGKLDGNYAFNQAKLMFLDKSTKKEIVIDSSDTYFDQRSNYIYIRDVAESKFDYVYNMKEEKLLKFTRY